jgi:hypothetical protein
VLFRKLINSSFPTGTKTRAVKTRFIFRQQLHPLHLLPISSLQVLACFRLSLSQEAEIQDEVWLRSFWPLKRFSQPAEVLRVFFYSYCFLERFAVRSYFRFLGLVTPVVWCQARNLNVHTVSSNQPLNAEAR